MLRRLLFVRIAKGDAEEVGEVLVWGGDPNSVSNKGTPAIIRATRGFAPTAGVIRVLLDQGADPAVTDAEGRTALDHVRRRLAKYQGRPRKPPRRSRALTPGGELVLPEWKWKRLEHERANPDFGDDFVEGYLEARRKAASRTFDTRSELEKMLPMLEAVEKPNDGAPAPSTA